MSATENSSTNSSTKSSQSTTESTFHKAICGLLTEILDGPPGGEAYVLNRGDVGMLNQLDTIDAAAASSRPMAGKTTVAAHVDHVHYGFSLINRWAAGEENPWADADWDASWRRGQVTDDEWKTLRGKLRGAVKAWQNTVATRADWDHMAASGAISTVAHTAYHLGAIRQILASLGKHAG